MNSTNTTQSNISSDFIIFDIFYNGSTFNKIYSDSGPYNKGEMNLTEAVRGRGELKKFMIKNTRKNDLLMFSQMANEGNFEDSTQVPFYIVLPLI